MTSNDDSVETVDLGTWVKVQEQDGGEEVFHIVQNSETDYLENKISPDNPVGNALMGSKPGEVVVIDGPRGKVEFCVLEVGPR